MKERTFESILRKGVIEAVFKLPFDPEKEWCEKAVEFGAGRRGWPCAGVLNRARFASHIVARAGRFYLLVDADLQRAAKLAIGDKAVLTACDRDPDRR